MVITIVSTRAELNTLQKHLGAIGGTSQSVSRVPEELKKIDLWKISDDDVEKIYGIVENEDEDTVSDDVKDADSTDTDEKYSPESSDVSEQEGSTTAMCNGGSLAQNNTCSCDIFEAKPTDIEQITGPCLLSVAKRESHWRDVLPVLVYESKLSLNVPLVLVRNKLIRVKNCDRVNEELSIQQDTGRKVQVITFESKCDDVSILSFDEIKSKIEHGLKLNGDIEDPIHNKDALVKLKDEQTFGKFISEIPLNDSEDINGLLSFEEIKSKIESDSKLCKDTETFVRNKNVLPILKDEKTLENSFEITPDPEEIKIEEKLNFIREILHRYECNREKLENILEGFDHFDIVGWMAVDENHNIMEDLESNDCEVFQFDLLKCVSGKNHVISVPISVDSELENADNEGKISALNLERMNLSSPVSLENITENLMLKNTDTLLKHYTNKTYINTDQSIYKVCSIEDPLKERKEKNVNGLNITTKESKMKNSKCKEVIEKGEIRNQFEEPLQQSTLTTLFQRKPSSTKCNGGIKVNSKNVSSRHSCNNKMESNQSENHTTNISASMCTFKAGVESDSKICLNCNTGDYLRQISMEDYFESKEKEDFLGSTESSEKDSVSSSLSEDDSVPNRSDYRATLSSGNESGSYVDMSCSLSTWQKLHDPDESDTNTSTNTDSRQHMCYEDSQNVYHSTDSSRYTLQGIKNRAPRTCNHKMFKEKRHEHNAHKTSHRGSGDGYVTSESNGTSRHSFETACSKHEGIERDHVYCLPRNTTPSYMNQDRSRYRAPRERNNTHRHQTHHQNWGTSADHHRTAQSTFSGHPLHFHEPRQASTRIEPLALHDLSCERFRTWYAEVRQRAEEIAHTEYMNFMCFH